MNIFNISIVTIKHFVKYTASKNSKIYIGFIINVEVRDRAIKSKIYSIGKSRA